MLLRKFEIFLKAHIAKMYSKHFEFHKVCMCNRCAIDVSNYDFSTFEYAAENTAASAAESRQVGPPLEDKTGGILNPQQVFGCK